MVGKLDVIIVVDVESSSWEGSPPKGQESEMSTGIDAGAYDYILKPFAPDQLTTRIAEILKKFGIEGA